MDIFDVFRRYNIPYVTEGSKVTKGWVNVRCPFCRGSDFHLGFNLAERFFHCWRCGWKRVDETLMALCSLGEREARKLAYDLRSAAGPPRAPQSTAHLVHISRYRRPSDIGPLRPSHRRYLEGRGFDPDKIVAEWDVCSTGPASYLNRIDYRYRLFIPIMWEGREVSFQTRDVTGKAEQKYKACPTGAEVVHHKDILYARPECFKATTAIAVEGVTDAWRLGPSAFALFGIGFKLEQVVEIIRRFKRVAIVFDGEPQAQVQARKLLRRLEAVMDCGDDEVFIYKLGVGQDPGSLSESDAAHLVRQVR